MPTVQTRGESFWVLLGQIGVCSLEFGGWSSEITFGNAVTRATSNRTGTACRNGPDVLGERHCISAVAFMVAGGGFEPPTFGLCDLTHLSMRVGLYLHPRGVLAIQS